MNKYILALCVLFIWAFSLIPSAISAEGDSLWCQYYIYDNHQGAGQRAICHTLYQNQYILGVTSPQFSWAADYWFLKVNPIGDLIWSYLYDSGLNDLPDFVISLDDGGAILAGTSYYGAAFIGYIWLIRTDSLGNSLWSQQYGIDGENKLIKLIPTEDGGCLLGSNYHPYLTGNYDIEIFRIESDGDTLWTLKYGSTADSSWEETRDVVPAGDGGFLVAGWQNYVGVQNSQIILIRLNVVGDTLWTKTHGWNNTFEQPISILPLNEGFLLNCMTSGPGSIDARLMKIDTNGASCWWRALGSNGSDWFSKVLLTPDSSLLAVGKTSSFTSPHFSNLWLVKLNTEGNTQWERTYGLDSLYEDFLDILPTSDGGYLISCHQHDLEYTFGNLWLLKINSNGDTLWTRTYLADDALEQGADLLQADDGNYLVCRSTAVSLQEVSHIVLMCLEGPNSVVLPQPQAALTRFALYPPSPNPFNPSTAISYQLQAASHVHLQVFDTTGRLVATLVDGRREAGTHEVTFDGSNLPSGVYLYTLTAGQHSVSGKMVLLK